MAGDPQDHGPSAADQAAKPLESPLHPSPDESDAHYVSQIHKLSVVSMDVSSMLLQSFEWIRFADTLHSATGVSIMSASF